MTAPDEDLGVWHRAEIHPTAWATACPVCEEPIETDADECDDGVFRVPPENRFVICPSCEAQIELVTKEESP